MISIKQTATTIKAVGMISGGLDSLLAAKIMRDLGVEVHGVYFAMPWGCCDKDKALKGAAKLGIQCLVLQLDERYLEIVKKPKHGYGAALNPCVDCRIHMFSRAQKYMEQIGAHFVFTGEVVGQRPMSQLKHKMELIERNSGLQGRLLRPLCAQILEPTIPELDGLVDRKKLLALTGRGRRDQLDLADQFGITDFLAPAGGCLLTDKHFAVKMKDTFKFGYRSFRETIALKWGRHFRYNSEFKIILGRDELENESLKSYAHMDDLIMELPDRKGPTLILKGTNPSTELLTFCAGLIQKFSIYKNAPPKITHYWKSAEPNNQFNIQARMIEDTELEPMKI